jgi:hypothetical protein
MSALKTKEKKSLKIKIREESRKKEEIVLEGCNYPGR